MECLQVIAKLNNTEQDCPAAAGRCELLYDSENVRMLLRLGLITPEPGSFAMYADIACYDKDGCMLSVVEFVEYSDGGMLIELPSLMTASVRIILRLAEYSDGRVWKSELEFQKKIDLTSKEEQSFDNTVRFESVNLPNKEDEQAERVSSKLSRAERRAIRRERIAEEEEIRRMIKYDPHERRKRVVARIVSLLLLAGACVGGVYAYQYKVEADTAYTRAMNLYNSGRIEDAVPELEKANGYKFFGEKASELKWCLAMSCARQRSFKTAAMYFRELGGYKESRANYRSILKAYSGIVSAGGKHTLALRGDGTVAAEGDGAKGQCDVSEWTDMTAVAAGGEHSVALNRDKSVSAVGDNSDGQCNVIRWDDITDIAAGANHTVGVKTSGRVEATGDNTYGQCEVGEWAGVISADAGDEHTVGLRIDGTVIATGSNSHGECNVSEWNNIVQVAAGNGFTAGLRADGRVLVTGSIAYVGEELKKQRDIFAVSAGSYNLLVVRTDGRVTSYGGNDSSQGATSLWTDVVAADGGARHSAAVHADGTVSGTGDNGDSQISLEGMKEIGLPKSTVTIRKGE